MCGRYTLHMNKKKLAEAIALAVPETYEPNYNLGPGREVLSIVNDQESKSAKASMMHWGLRTPQNFHVNARITPRRAFATAGRTMLPDSCQWVLRMVRRRYHQTNLLYRTN